MRPFSSTWFCLLLLLFPHTFPLAFDYVVDIPETDNMLLSFVLSGRGTMHLDMGNRVIPISKRKSRGRCYFFFAPSGTVRVYGAAPLEIAELGCFAQAALPYADIFDNQKAQGLVRDKAFILHLPEQKIAGKLKYLSFKIFDTDNPWELALYVNNRFVRFLPKTGNNRWSETITLDISAFLDRFSSRDVVVFSSRHPRTPYTWQVAGIRVSQGLPIPHEAVAGYIPPGNRSFPNYLVNSLLHTQGQAALAFSVYNNTKENPISMECNGHEVALLRGRSPKERWSGLQVVSIPAWCLQEGANTVVFKNVSNIYNERKKPWAVRRISQCARVGEQAYGFWETRYQAGEIKDSVVYTLGPAFADTVLHFDLFDIDARKEVDLYVNQQKVRTFSRLTGNNAWARDISVTVDKELLKADSDNTIVFKNRYSHRPGFYWAVRLKEAVQLKRLPTLERKPEIGLLPVETAKPDQEPYTDSLIQSVQLANRQKQEAPPELQPPAPELPSPAAPPVDEKTTSFAFTTDPEGAQLFVGATPHYPGRYLGVAPFTQELAVPGRTYFMAMAPYKGTFLFFHNPSLPFPEFQYYVNVKPLRQFSGAMRSESLTLEKPRDISLVNASPLLGDTNMDGELELVVGTSNGRLLVFTRTDDKRYTFAHELLNLPDQNYLVPFLLDFNNDFQQDLLVGTQEGRLLLFLADENGDWRDPVPLLEGLIPRQVDSISPFVFDLDGDRKKDLLFGTGAQGIFYALNAGEDHAPRFDRLHQLALPFEPPRLLAPCVFLNFKTGSYSMIVGTQDGCLIMCDGPDMRAGELSFNSVVIFSNYDTINLGYDLVPRVVDRDNDACQDILIGNRSGEVVNVFFEIPRGE